MKKLLNLAVVVLLLSMSGCTGECTCKADMTAEDAQRATDVQALAQKAWTDKDKSALMSEITDDFVRTVNGETVASGKAEMQSAMDVFFTAFPDMKLDITRTTVGDKTIVNEWTAIGTHTGAFGEIAATGKPVSFNGTATISYNDEGKITREDVFMDELTLMEQLGFILAQPMAEAVP